MQKKAAALFNATALEWGENRMVARIVIVFLSVLTASILPELLFSAGWVFYAKIAALSALTLACLLVKRGRSLWRLPFVLLVIVLAFRGSALLRAAPWWSPLFRFAGFFQEVTGNVAVKVLGLLPVAAALLLLFKTPARAFLAPGNLRRKAERIPWLGIRGGVLPWGRLAPVSGVLIMAGTVLLSIVTGLGVPSVLNGARLLQYLPLILALAFVNSFCEGLVFRSALLAPLNGGLPKLAVLLAPALFFGVAHIEGIPGGLLGGALSGVLGYFMSLSMVETEGFLSGWIIHALQDFAIFSTLALIG